MTCDNDWRDDIAVVLIILLMMLMLMPVQRHTSSVRLGIVHNVDMEALNQRTAVGHLCIARAVDVALETLDVGVAKMFVTKLVKEENVEALTTGARTWDDLAVSVSGSLLMYHFYDFVSN